MLEEGNGRHQPGVPTAGELVEFARREAEQSSLGEIATRRAPPPDSFPGYTIVKEIHHGGQGVVYEAVQHSTRRTVAIKVPRQGAFAGDVDVARFRREAEILGRIKHPNVVGVLDAGVCAGQYFLVTDFIPGVSLDRYLEWNGRDAQGRVDLKILLPLFERICDGVNAAHLRGIIHRDLKPSNILLDSAGEPHVVDFGLGRSLATVEGERAEISLLTETGQFVGCLPWVSPEQALGDSDKVDVRTDVYALGLILYFMLTGQLPYRTRGSMHTVVETIKNATPSRPSRVEGGIDDDLDTIVLKCLNKDPERRYQSAGELRDEIERHLKGEAINAKRESTWYVLRCLVRRRKWLALAAVVGLAVLLVYVASVSVMYRRARVAEADALAHAKRAVQARSDLQSTASFVVQRLAEGLTQVPGSSAMRKELLELSYAQLARLMEDNFDDPTLQADYARARVGLSDIGLSIGRRGEALKHRLAALDIREKLAAREPDNPDHLRDLAVSYVLIGDVLIEDGRTDETQRLYERALAIDEQLTAEHPDEPRFADNLVYSYERMGHMAFRDTDFVEADDYFRKGLAVARGLAAKHPQSVSALSAVIASTGRVTHLCSMLGDSTEATRIRFDVLPLARQLNNTEPYNPRFMVQLLGLLGEIAVYEAATGNIEEAYQRNVDEAGPLIQRLLELDPQNVEYRIALAANLIGRGQLKMRMGNRKEGEQWMLEAIQVLEALNESVPENQTVWGLTMGANVNLANLAHLREDVEARQSYASAALGWADSLMERTVADASLAGSMADFWLDPVVPELQCSEKAEEMARLGVDLSRGKSPALWSVLARALHSNGKQAEALDAAQKALAMCAPDDFRVRPVAARLVSELNPGTGRELP